MQGAFCIWLVWQGVARGDGWRVGRDRLLSRAQLEIVFPSALVSNLSSLQTRLRGLGLRQGEAALLAGLALLQPGSDNLKNRAGACSSHQRLVECLHVASPRMGSQAGKLVADMAQVSREHWKALQSYRDDPLYSQSLPPLYAEIFGFFSAKTV